MSAATSPSPDHLETATFCATLVDEWVRSGLSDAVVTPGSRNTPLTLALAAEPRLRVHVVLDERSAGFMALGLGLGRGRPALVATTSGTAAAELLPAVVEAHQARVPMVVCTADRPPELQQVGAPQTIDQTRLYGSAVRFSGDAAVADPAQAATWRSLASRLWLEATGTRPGPVHLNLPFREPLVGRPGRLPPGRPGGRPWHQRLPVEVGLPAAAARDLVADWAGRRGVLVAGAGVDDPEALLDLAERVGWPVLADPRSGCRRRHPAVVAHADALVRRAGLAERLRPEVVVRLGDPPASRVLGGWLAGSGASLVVIDPAAAAGGFVDPDRRVDLLVPAAAGAVARCLLQAAADGVQSAPGGGEPPVPSAAQSAAGWKGSAEPPPAATGQPCGGVGSPGPWLASWRAADDAAARALDTWLAEELGASEPGVTRAVAEVAGESDVLVVSSSMPVRDLEWYGPTRGGLRVVANRGANGIDGVLSTATGVALAGPTTWLLIGDLALLHDSTGLLGLAGRALRLRLVVVDNAGGGIFSFLPQAAALPAPAFERFYGTPQDVDVAGLLEVHGIPVGAATSAGEVAAGLARLVTSTAPVEALVVRTDRSINVDQHNRLNLAMGVAAEAAVASA